MYLNTNNVLLQTICIHVFLRKSEMHQYKFCVMQSCHLDMLFMFKQKHVKTPSSSSLVWRITQLQINIKGLIYSTQNWTLYVKEIFTETANVDYTEFPLHNYLFPMSCNIFTIYCTWIIQQKPESCESNLVV